jgi:hypothetical protein
VKEIYGFDTQPKGRFEDDKFAEVDEGKSALFIILIVTSVERVLETSINGVIWTLSSYQSCN